MSFETDIADLFDAYSRDGAGLSLAATDRFRDVDPRISVWDEYNRSDYEYFRPEERLPKTLEESLRMCGAAYRQFGIVKKMVDLISDFVCKGITLYHPQKSASKLYKAWWKYIKAKNVSSTFCNYLVRQGNNVVVREVDTKSRLSKKLAAYAENFDEARQYATGYYVYLPTDVALLDKESSRLSRNKLYGLKLDYGTQKLLKKRKLKPEEEFIKAGLPSFVQSAQLIQKHNAVIMPPERTRTFHYKKDTTDNWAYPITHAILDDLILLKKLKLCDLNAADGLISHIMHCKIGSLDKDARIIPNREVIEAWESAILAAVAQGRPVRAVTGPEIAFEFHVPDTSAFLGEDKYKPILSSIYAGYGIPPALTGQALGSGLSNNAISLEVLLQCLEDIRNELIRFWEYEIKLFQKAMGLQKPAKLIFEHINFQDRHAILALVLQLVDRKIISADRAREVFGFDSEIERDRLDEENAMPEEKRHVSALADAQPQHAYKKIALQAGYVTPGQIGVEVTNEDRNEGEKTSYEMEQEKMKAQQKLATQKQKGVSGQGRPPGAKDKTKRSTRTVTS